MKQETRFPGSGSLRSSPPKTSDVKLLDFWLWQAVGAGGGWWLVEAGGGGGGWVREIDFDYYYYQHVPPAWAIVIL